MSPKRFFLGRRNLRRPRTIPFLGPENMPVPKAKFFFVKNPNFLKDASKNRKCTIYTYKALFCVSVSPCFRVFVSLCVWSQFCKFAHHNQKSKESNSLILLIFWLIKMLPIHPQWRLMKNWWRWHGVSSHGNSSTSCFVWKLQSIKKSKED